MPSLLEFAPEAAVRVPEAHPDQEEAGSTDEPASGGPRENRRGCLVRLRVLRLLPRAREDLHGRDGQRDVDEAAAGVADAPADLLEHAVPVLVRDERLDEPPERIRGKAHGQRDEQELPEAVLRERVERSRPARRLAAVAEGELDGEEADDPVGNALRDQPDPREHRVPAAARGGRAACAFDRLADHPGPTVPRRSGPETCANPALRQNLRSSAVL